MEKYLEQLYNLALESSKNGDIPVGCIIIKNGNILSTGHNTRKCDNLVIGHAEINAICEAEKILGDFRLNGCILLTTLKPCKLCFETIEASRIDKVYYLLDQNLNGLYEPLKYIKLDIGNNEYIDKYKKLFLDFFKNMR